MTRETSKFMVSVLNLKKLEKHAVLFLIENGHDMSGASLTLPYAPFGIVKDVNGKHYLIDNEGCGTFIPLEDEKCSIEWYKNVKVSESETHLGMYPVMETTLDFSEVTKIPVEKTVSLDKFIRVFGSRLDQNCHRVERFLKGEIDRTGQRIVNPVQVAN